jgi:UDP-2,4-diacetamido-2,4,6-trideoxy-beta-L-altropyranose hydrolase
MIFPSKVVFRVDASLLMGNGHVMRCLTLANELTEEGAKCYFICREHKGHLFDVIRRHNHILYSLLDEVIDEENKPLIKGKHRLLSHASWLGCHWQVDAIQSRNIIDKIKPDLLVIDHYAIDYAWESYVHDKSRKVMVIDDLANRKHLCDFLHDQTYLRKPKDYRRYISSKTELLLGTRFSLLRPEFFRTREFSLKRRINNGSVTKQLLISVGGVDPNNLTGKIISELLNANMLDKMKVIVVLGGNAPWRDDVIKLSKMAPKNNIEIKVDVQNMADIVSNSDLAIGAAGSSTWERCCLGVPTIQVVIAANQNNIASTLSEINSVVDITISEVKRIKEIIANMRNMLPKLSVISSSIANGKGVYNVINYLKHGKSGSSPVDLKAAAKDDCQYVYELQADTNVRKFFRTPEVPKTNEHEEWFNKKLNSDNSVLFIITKEYENVGMVRIDGLLEDATEVSIIVSSSFKGQGIAQQAISILIEILPSQILKAFVHHKNIASQKVFEKMGFKLNFKEKLFWTYIRGTQ